MNAPSIDVVQGSVQIHRLDLGRFRVSAVRFPAGYRIPSHTHERACVSVILDGRFLQRFPGRSCDCLPGGVIAKPPEERHEDRWFDGVSHHLIVEPDPGRHDELGDARSLVEEVVHLHDPGAATLGRRLARELESGEPAMPLSVEGLTLELLARLHRGGGAGAERERGEPPVWLARVGALLHDRFREAVGMDELAAEAGVHPAHLSRAFSRFYGEPPGRYQRRLRLEAAKRALTETRDSISRIAARTGFVDQSHLTRTMRREEGVTPARYRRMTRGVSRGR